MTILTIQPGALDRFALKLRPTDTLTTLKTRIASKLPPPPPSSPSISLKYHFLDVWYQLDDADDWEVFSERFPPSHSHEIHLLVSGPSIPIHPPSTAPPPLYTPSILGQGHPGTDNPSTPVVEPLIVRPPPIALTGDDKSLRNGFGPPAPGARGTGAGTERKRPVSIHVLKDSVADLQDDTRSIASTTRTRKSKAKSTKARSIAGSVTPSVAAHKEAFKSFQESNGVRTVVGSIGRIQNVRMMIKKGYRSCYMSRAFALQHHFIPKDAALGHYGFSGITNLGSWPIQVGSKEVELQVMLIEDSYFPVILGRSFLEKCRIEFDPLNPRAIKFGHTGEIVNSDLVIVKDANDEAVPIS